MRGDSDTENVRRPAFRGRLGFAGLVAVAAVLGVVTLVNANPAGGGLLSQAPAASAALIEKLRHVATRSKALGNIRVASRRRPAGVARGHSLAAAPPQTASAPADDGADPGPIALAEVPPSVTAAPAPDPDPATPEEPHQEGPPSPPAPDPAPEPQPTPAPEPTPTPEPEPTPTPEPEPEPTPVPEPEPTPEPKPTPEPPSTPTTSPIFEGGAIEDFDEVQAARGAIREVPDPLGSGETVFQLTVDDDDVSPITATDNPRAQALSPALIKPGDEIWLRTKFLLPQDFPSVPGWMSLVSIYGEPFGGPSPWRIAVEGNELTWTRNGTYRYDMPWRVPVPKDRWVTVLLHERFASDGWVEMWIDGAPITFFGPDTYNPSKHAPTQHLEMATMDASNDGGPNSAKIMHYREAGMFDTATVYFGHLTIGATRESVGG